MFTPLPGVMIDNNLVCSGAPPALHMEPMGGPDFPRSWNRTKEQNEFFAQNIKNLIKGEEKEHD